MRITKTAISTEFIGKFNHEYPIKSYFAYVAHYLKIEDIFAVAGILCPSFVEFEGGVYLKENIMPNDTINLYCPYGNSLQELERYNNLFCVSDFFTYGGGELIDTEGFIEEFANILCFFWRQRLSLLYPEKNFVFEQKADLFDEEGLCITFYQDKKEQR